MSAEEQPPDVGTLHEEAVRLLGVLGGLTHQASAESGPDLGEDCRYCPVCRVIHVVRQTSPEVRAHLTTAATALLQAAAELLATHAPAPGTQGTDGAGVQRIDLDADD